MNGFWDMSIFMAPICKHFRAQKNTVQNLNGPNFFSENIPGVLKHILMRRWEKSDQKKFYYLFFCQTPTLLDPKMEHFERIYGHTKLLSYCHKYNGESKCSIRKWTKFKPNRLRIEVRINYFHFSSKYSKNVHQNHNFQYILLIFNWDDGLGPENTSVNFGAIILNGLTVIVFTRH